MRRRLAHALGRRFGEHGGRAPPGSGALRRSRRGGASAHVRADIRGPVWRIPGAHVRFAFLPRVGWLLRTEQSGEGLCHARGCRCFQRRMRADTSLARGPLPPRGEPLVPETHGSPVRPTDAALPGRSRRRRSAEGGAAAEMDRARSEVRADGCWHSASGEPRRGRGRGLPGRGRWTVRCNHCCLAVAQRPPRTRRRPPPTRLAVSRTVLCTCGARREPSGDTVEGA
jgi:hypothetical protein